MESRSLYAYPPEVENSAEMPESMKSKLDNVDGKRQIKIAVWSLSEVRIKHSLLVRNGTLE